MGQSNDNSDTFIYARQFTKQVQLMLYSRREIFQENITKIRKKR